MRRLILFLLILSSCNVKELELEGSYILVGTKQEHSVFVKEDTVTRKTIKVMRNGYWLSATFSGNKKVTVEKASGGSYKVENNKYIEVINFSSQDESLVGEVYTYSYKLNDGKYIFSRRMRDAKCENCLIEEEHLKVGSRDNLKDEFLEGVWRLQTSEWFGKKVEDSDLTTLKIYIYPRFAWGSYHSRGKDFIGTAGGTYDFDGKKLIEHVEFFSYYVAEPYEFPADITKFTKDSIQQISMNGAGKETFKKIKQAER